MFYNYIKYSRFRGESSLRIGLFNRGPLNLYSGANSYITPLSEYGHSYAIL